MGQNLTAVKKHLLCGKRQADGHDSFEHTPVQNNQIADSHMQGAVHPEQIVQRAGCGQIPGNIDGNRHAEHAHVQAVDKYKIQQHIHQVHNQ
ncbi:hypothetical protein D3C75_1046660 [compost metagenome]